MQFSVERHKQDEVTEKRMALRFYARLEFYIVYLKMLEMVHKISIYLTQQHIHVLNLIKPFRDFISFLPQTHEKSINW